MNFSSIRVVALASLFAVPALAQTPACDPIGNIGGSAAKAQFSIERATAAIQAGNNATRDLQDVIKSLSDAGYTVMRANQANIRANSAESYSAFIQALLKWGRCQPGQEHEPKFTALLGSIKGPTLVVTSDNDHLIPRELSELIATSIPGAKLVVMPGAGHIPFMEQPEQVTQITPISAEWIEHW